MKNRQRIFGKGADQVEVIEPAKVIKLGLVFDSYKVTLLDQLWAESYKNARMQLMHFNPAELFFTERLAYNKDGSILLECRYFTPQSNIRIRGH